MPENKKKIVIAGAFGCGNIGDDAILAGTLRLFDPDVWDITVLAADQPRIFGIEKVRIIRQSLNLGLSWSVLKAFDFSGILSAIRNADLLIIGGGALLHDLRFYNLPYFFGLQIWAKIWKLPIAYLNIGAGPVRTKLGKWLCRRFLSKADHISVRDENGKQELLKAGVKQRVIVTSDPAFMLTPHDVPDNILEIAKQENLPQKFIAVTICGWFQSEDFWHQQKLDLSEPIQRTADILDWIIDKTGIPLVFFPTVIPYDRALASKISEKMSRASQFQWLLNDHTVESMMGLLGKAQWLFGMRLHSMILSTIMKIPFFAVVYDQKVAHFMNAIGNPHRISLKEIYQDLIFKSLDCFIQDISQKGEKTENHPLLFNQKLQENFQQLKHMVAPHPEDTKDFHAT